MQSSARTPPPRQKAPTSSAAAPAPPAAAAATPAASTPAPDGRRASTPSPGIDFPSPYKNIRQSAPATPASTPVDSKARQATPLSLSQRTRSLLGAFSMSFDRRSAQGTAAGKAIEASGPPVSFSTPELRLMALAQLVNPDAGEEAGASPPETEARAHSRAAALRPSLARVLASFPPRELQALWVRLSTWVDEPQDERSTTPYSRCLHALQLELVAEQHFGKGTPECHQSLQDTLQEAMPAMARSRNFQGALSLLDMRLRALCRLADKRYLLVSASANSYTSWESTPHEHVLRAHALHQLNISYYGVQGARESLIDTRGELPVGGFHPWPVLEQMCQLACQDLTSAEHRALMRRCSDDKPSAKDARAKGTGARPEPAQQLRDLMRKTLEAYRPQAGGASGSRQDAAPSPPSASGRPAGTSEAKGAGGSTK